MNAFANISPESSGIRVFVPFSQRNGADHPTAHFVNGAEAVKRVLQFFESQGWITELTEGGHGVLSAIDAKGTPLHDYSIRDAEAHQRITNKIGDER